MNWPTYCKSEYSQDKWPGGLPEGWTTRRLKTVLTEPLLYGANEAADSDDPANPRFVRITDIAANGGLKPDTFRSLPAEKARPYMLNEGDLLFARSGATVGKSVIYSSAWGEACFAGYLIRARPNPNVVSAKYVRYFTESLPYWQHIASEQIQSTIQNVSAERYGNLLIPMPDLLGQNAIVAFLDRETTKIEALINKQNKLIVTLVEDRTASISHAVTKGLNPDAQMKDSGVQWIGEFPRTWTAQRLSWLFNTISSGTTPSSDRPEYYGGDINWVTTGELRESVIVDTVKKVTRQALIDHSPLVVYPTGALLIAMYGATIGRLGILGAPACTNQACCVFVGPTTVETKFAFYALSAGREHLILIASGGGQPNINQDKLRSLRIALPPMTEQRAIVDYLDAECIRIDALVEKATDVIAILREYRSALVTAAVTGKIDVREAV